MDDEEIKRCALVCFVHPGGWPKFSLFYNFGYLPCPLAFEFVNFLWRWRKGKKRAFNIFKSYEVRNFWQKIILDQIGPIKAWFGPERASEWSNSWLGLGALPKCPCSPAQETSYGHHSVRGTFSWEGAQIPPHVFSPVRWGVCGEFMICSKRLINSCFRWQTKNLSAGLWKLQQLVNTKVKFSN